MNDTQLKEFGAKYAAAWSSQSAASLAAFYADGGSLKVNQEAPAVGRAAITAKAQEFMTAFPDMVVRMDEIRQDGGHVVFRWTWTSSSSTALIRTSPSEPLTGPREVFWLNTFESEAQRQKVTEDYTKNRTLMAVLQQDGERKARVTGTPSEVLLTHRRDLSRGAPWSVAGARFLVVTVTRGDRLPEGSVFESLDGTRYALLPAATREQADRAAETAGPEVTVLAVRPQWGMPAMEWVVADPGFWKSNPRGGARTERPRPR